MTRTDVMASSRPRTAGAAERRTSRAVRRLIVLPVVLLLGIALLAPGSAFAASEPNTTTGYNQEPNKPETGTSPSKETTTPSTTPSSETAPSKTTATPAPTTQTLPYTGLDLRWSFGLGLLLVGAGFSLVVVQRRQRRDGGR